MKSEKGQSLVMVGVALFLLAGLCLYLGLSQPKISSGVLVETPTTAVQSGTTTQSAATTVGRSAASRTATAAQTAASGNAGTVSYPVNLNTATFEEFDRHSRYRRPKSGGDFGLSGADWQIYFCGTDQRYSRYR